MLILTRRIGETLIINGNIEVQLLAINGAQARIGIKAPKEVSVHREEIEERIRRENAVGMGTKTARFSTNDVNASNVPQQRKDLEK